MPITWEQGQKYGDRPAEGWMPSLLVQVSSSWLSWKFMVGSYQLIGTGGTVAGVGQYLKSKNEEIVVAIADPEGSGLYNKVGARSCIHPQQADNVSR